jgi:hypothetical protein
MKEHTLVEMKNKIGSLTRVMQGLINEINNIKDFSIGTIETMKFMPGYDEAISKLKESISEDNEDKKTNKDVE